MLDITGIMMNDGSRYTLDALADMDATQLEEIPSALTGTDAGYIPDTATLGDIKNLADALEDPTRDTIVRGVMDIGREYAQPFGDLVSALEEYQGGGEYTEPDYDGYRLFLGQDAGEFVYNQVNDNPQAAELIDDDDDTESAWFKLRSNADSPWMFATETPWGVVALSQR